ncbi:MAG: class I SAM-dependent methyltransferase [Gammaproteobacteria bacterium]
MSSPKKHRYRKQQDNSSKIKMADKADKHKLYEQAVQSVEAEIDFVDETFKSLRNREAILLREDFCGTACTSCEWVKRRDNDRAFSVDLDPEVLEWGRNNNIAALTNGQTERIQLLNDNVMSVNVEPVDAILAMNFSYWIFKDRAIMISYFQKVYDDLVDNGIFFLDAFGGYEAFQEMKEDTDNKKFTYIWDQASYNPVNGHCVCKIHFKFKDGSKIKNAFTYEWRLWTLPELTEMLTEAGFKPTVYWEGTDEDGDGNGVFEPTTEGEADAGWIAYLVAEK